MSLQFNVTSSPYNGLIQIYEKEIGANRGFISGDSDRLAEVTTDINLTWDDYLRIAFEAGGRWQYDDSNHTDYPIITTDLVANQRDYSFTTDENSNLILDIYRVAVLADATSTLYDEINPVDAQTPGEAPDIVSGNTATGVPRQYDKTANGIFLDPVPATSITDGLKLYINREASYFVVGDTTKKPGCPGNHHKYFAIKPAYEYARRNSLSNVGALFNEVQRLEAAIKEDFANRDRDSIDIITMKKINYV